MKADCDNEKCDCGCECEDECECEHCDCEKDCKKEKKDPVEELKKEHALMKDALLRAHAEMENIRKRTVKEKEESLKFANTKFAKELLEVIDNLERALESTKEEELEKNAKALLDGVKLTHKALLAAFAKNGITKIDTKKSDEFNHDIHQIMCEVASEDVKPGQVVDIYQNGYTINGRLLRPVLVSVAAKK